jgi:hypothetical protein
MFKENSYSGYAIVFHEAEIADVYIKNATEETQDIIS